MACIDHQVRGAITALDRSCEIFHVWLYLTKREGREVLITSIRLEFAIRGLLLLFIRLGSWISPSAGVSVQQAFGRRGRPHKNMAGVSDHVTESPDTESVPKAVLLLL